MDEFVELVNNMTTSHYASTTESPQVHFSASIGYVSIAVAVTLFGSSFVPVKKFETGDGMFFQWILCSVIWIGGLVVNCIRHFPQFYPLAMLGGFLWCTGNMLCVPIIKTVGLGQGMCIWASLNLLSGWASGRFGWFGMTPEVPPNPSLNYVGVCLCAVSAIVYMFLKTDVQPVSQTTAPAGDGSEPLIQNERGLMNESLTSFTDSTETAVFERLPPLPKRIVGTIMASAAGILFGLNFVPVIYIKNNYPKQNVMHDIDYVFAHFSGILVTSTVYFAIYCAVMRNRPKLYPQAILPAMCSGVMWAIADIGWFVANDALSAAISFPIITTIPAIFAAFWGILFKEISGVRNLLVLLLAIAFAVSGSIVAGLSKLEPEHHDHHNMTTPVLDISSSS